MGRRERWEVKTGFFTREEAGAKKRKRAPRAGVSAETLQKLGPEAVRGMNLKAESPLMEPEGPTTDAEVYILGEAPGEVEDEKGRPFVGKSGKLLRRSIIDESVTVFDNVVRTRPPGNRDPKSVEVECFRKLVEASIEEATPNVIIGTGKVPLTWATGLTNIKAARGRKFPVKIGDHVCWFCPVVHPAFLLRIEDRRDDKVPGEEWRRTWENDLERAYALADGGEEAVVVSPEEAREGIERLDTASDIETVLEILSESADVVGFDFETHHYRPYHKDSQVLSLAIASSSTAYAFGIDHGEARWSRKARTRIIDALREFFISGPLKIAHNLPFDFEWAVHLLGEEVASGEYGCSQQAAFVLDPGPPGPGTAGHSLNFQCLLRYGLNLKALTFAGSWGGRLREMQLSKLLDYNALDAKWCLQLWRDLMKDVEAAGLEESYERQIDRVAPVVFAQRIGVPVDQECTRAFQVSFEKQSAAVVERIVVHPEVGKYERTLGKFNPASPEHVGKLLGDVMGFSGVTTKAGRYTTRAGILEGLDDESGIVEMILELRSLAKLKGTYVDRFLIDHPKTYVYPDGRIHCRFGISKTRTVRFQSEDPNNQNWPKRKHKEVRRQLVAPPGHVFVAVDQGQIEARVLAMESLDPEWIRMIHEDYDVHQEWAERIAGIDDDFAQFLEDEPKEARHKSKNGWVFPAFYGAQIESIMRTLDLPDDAHELFAEFWEVFAGIREWQQEKIAQYYREGCVWSLTGRRRLAPLNENMIINTGIQCTASDICVDAMVRLFKRAIDEDARFLMPVMQIHDDLTFIMPESELEYGVAAVVEEQLGFKADWLNVPLMVEVEVGPNLLDMESVGVWRSDEIELEEREPDPRFNSEDADEARDEAIQRVDRNANKEWKKNANRALLDVARRKEKYTTDDIVRVMTDWGVYGGTHEPRALGAVMQRGKSNSIHVPTSEYSDSDWVKCHSRPKRVWRSLLFSRDED